MVAVERQGVVVARYGIGLVAEVVGPVGVYRVVGPAFRVDAFEDVYFSAGGPASISEHPECRPGSASGWQ